MEKPACVDPVGARSIIATSKKAEALGLTIITGTQRRPSTRLYRDLQTNCKWR